MDYLHPYIYISIQLFFLPSFIYLHKTYSVPVAQRAAVPEEGRKEGSQRGRKGRKKKEGRKGRKKRKDFEGRKDVKEGTKE